MIERQFVDAKKKEHSIKEFIKAELGKGKISKIDLERTPLGEKIVVHTTKPGIIIGRKGENIQSITEILKKKFNLENPQVEVFEIQKPEFDAQFVADYIASSLERFGPIRFKAVAYRALQRIIDSGGLGGEIRLSGKLPGERARSWRFAFGFLKKTGQPAELVVNKAYATGYTKPGAVGIKVSIVPSDADIKEIKEKEILMEEIPVEKVEAVSQKQGESKGKVK